MEKREHNIFYYACNICKEHVVQASFIDHTHV